VGDDEAVFEIVCDFLEGYTRPTYTRDETTTTDVDARTRQHTSPEESLIEDDLCDRTCGVASLEDDTRIRREASDRDIIGELDSTCLSRICIYTITFTQYGSSGSRCAIDLHRSFQYLGEYDRAWTTDGLACGIDTLPDITWSSTARILEVSSGRSPFEESSIVRCTSRDIEP
jgi:hypothetical protein